MWCGDRFPNRRAASTAFFPVYKVKGRGGRGADGRLDVAKGAPSFATKLTCYTRCGTAQGEPTGVTVCPLASVASAI